MTYTNATFYLDLEAGSDTARTALTSVTVANNGSGLVRCTKTAHGLVTGAVGTASLNYAGDWKITVIDANNFDLVGSTFSTSTSLTFTPFGGSSKADAWKTYTSGATAAHIAPGDIIRVKASTDETLVGNATWTNLSKTVTLAAAVTATVSDCETAWTGTTNVTVTADTVDYKENTKSMKAVIAAAFTTGKAAYFATGTLNLSTYQQLSFWLTTNATFAASALSIRLCTDTIGDVSVHTIPIPAKTDSNSWSAFTVDLATNLNAAVASVALYVDVDFGAVTVQLDNLIACKASASADSLSLTSLIGKVWNLPWVASTTYASADLRRPTQPNRNGFLYKVTAGGGGAAGGAEPTWPAEIGVTVADGALTWTCFSLEETWYPIQSIIGTTVKLDNGSATLGSAGRGYAGTTETVASYKRETVKQPMTTNFSSSNTGYAVTDSGTIGAPITFTGGWNRTDMTTKTGETWTYSQNGWGASLSCGGFSFLNIDNLCSTRGNYGVDATNGANFRFTNIHNNGASAAGINLGSSTSSPYTYLQNIVSVNTVQIAFGIGSGRLTGSCITINGSTSGTAPLNLANGYSVDLNYVVMYNNAATSAIIVSQSAASPVTVYLRNLTTANNAGNVITDIQGRAVLTNFVFSEAVPFFVNSTYYNAAYTYSQKHGGVADSHYISTEGGNIVSATDQRHTASGISWKFRPTNVARHANNPLRLSLAKLVCVANAAVSVTIWTRRDSTNIVGTLKVAGGQLGGVANDVTVACAPTINTWVQSSALTFTPTEAGVIEITYECYDGTGTTAALWIDDLAVS